jgi:hypothetical protein
MQKNYDLVGRETFPQVRLKNRGALLNYTDSKVAAVDYLEIFHFVPKAVAERNAAGRVMAKLPGD